MSIALNARWMMTTEHELHYDHLLYLREKIFSNIAGTFLFLVDLINKNVFINLSQI